MAFENRGAIQFQDVIGVAEFGERAVQRQGSEAAKTVWPPLTTNFEFVTNL